MQWREYFHDQWELKSNKVNCRDGSLHIVVNFVDIVHCWGNSVLFRKSSTDYWMSEYQLYQAFTRRWYGIFLLYLISTKFLIFCRFYQPFFCISINDIYCNNTFLICSKFIGQPFLFILSRIWNEPIIILRFMQSNLKNLKTLANPYIHKASERQDKVLLQTRYCDGTGESSICQTYRIFEGCDSIPYLGYLCCCSSNLCNSAQPVFTFKLIAILLFLLSKIVLCHDLSVWTKQ